MKPDLLALVYGWFTEDFDTLDLKEAKAFARRAARLTANFETASKVFSFKNWRPTKTSNHFRGATSSSGACRISKLCDQFIRSYSPSSGVTTNWS